MRGCFASLSAAQTSETLAGSSATGTHTALSFTAEATDLMSRLSIFGFSTACSSMTLTPQPVEELGKLDLLAERERIARGLARLADRGICHGNVFHHRFLLFSENKKSLKPTGFRDEIASRYHPAYPPPHGGRSLSDSDKPIAGNEAKRAMLLVAVRRAYSGSRLTAVFGTGSHQPPVL